MNHYTSFIELVSAFNFAFVASEKLSNLFFEKIRTTIEKINESKNKIYLKISVLQEVDKFKEIELEYYVLNILSKFLNIETINDNLKRTENKIQKIFLLSGLYGVVLLFFSGQEEYHSIFPCIELIIFDIGFIVLILFNLFRLKSILTNIFNILLLFWLSCLIGHYYFFNCKYQKYFVDLSLIFTLLGFVFAFFIFGIKRLGISFAVYL